MKSWRKLQDDKCRKQAAGKIGRSPACVLFALLICLASACGPHAKNQLFAGDAAHPLNLLEPTREALPNSLEWFAARDEEIYDASFDAQWGHPAFLSPKDSRVEPLQAWIAQLHNALVMAYPDRFSAQDPLTGQPLINPPVVRVMVHNDPNAFVSSALVCYKVAVQFAVPPTGALSDGRGDIVMIGKNGTVGSTPRGRLACVDRMMTASDPAEVVRYLKNNAKLGACTLSVQGELVVLGGGCRLSREIHAAGAGGIALESVANRVTVTTGLIDLYKDDALLAYGLLHELGHYYRSHGALTKSEYTFFYRHTADNWRRATPLADREPALNALGTRLLAMPHYRTQPIAGQLYHSEMFSYYPALASGLVTKACGEQGAPCHGACSGFIAMASDPKIAEQFGHFPQARLVGTALELYGKYERETARCLGAIRVQTQSQPGTGEVSARELKAILWMAVMPPDLTAVDYHMLQAYQTMSDGLFAKERQQNGLLQQALEEHIGYYTTEQEADNFALSWLFALGFDGEVGVRHWLRYTELRDEMQQDSPYNFSYQRCRALYTAEPRWSEMGHQLQVPVGSFADPHHSFCYRAYNMERRIAFGR